MSHAPQYGLSRKKRTKQGNKAPVMAQSPLVIPVEAGQANCDTIRGRSNGFMRLNTGYWHGVSKGRKATSSPVETVPIEPYKGAKRARGQAKAGQQAYGALPDLAVTVTLHLWHKSAKAMGGKGNVISKR